ncbi:MAG: polysaccharide biosynthesis tyrosine autokinase [Phycisphaerales bacterium]|nr:polysaccharide biosynthesis tyrosine autokinase [Phycisphaerales bacterium]
MVSQQTPRGPAQRARQTGMPQQSAGALNMATIDPMRMLRMYYPWMIGALVVGTIVGLAAFFIIARFWPKYSATVLFETLPPKTANTDQIGSMINTQGGGAKEQEIYMRTQVELMQSDQVLAKVLREPAFLQTKWVKEYTKGGIIENQQETLEELNDIVNARMLPDTNIIRMNVTTRGRQDCAVIANTISEVYLQDNKQVEIRDIQQRRTDMDQQVRTLRQKLVSLDQQIEALLGNAGITALEERNSVWAVEMTNIQYLMAQTTEGLTQSREQLAGYERMLNSPGGIVYPDTVRQAAEEEYVVRTLLSQITITKSELAASRERYGDNHREVVRRESLLRNLQNEYVRVVEQQMEIKFNSLLDGMRTQVRSLEATEVELKNRLADITLKMNETTAILKQAESLTADREGVVTQLTEFEIDAGRLNIMAQGGARMRVIQPGEPPEIPSFPKLRFMLPLSIFTVCALVGGVILLKELREQRVRSPQDLAMIPQTTVLGCIPDLAMDLSAPEHFETAVTERPHGAIAESVRQIRTGLLRTLDEQGHTTVLLAGGMPDAGTTSVVANLAQNLANIGKSVLVIDANLRRPRMHEVLGVPQAPGLAEILNGSASFDDSVRETSNTNLSILPAGEKRTGAFERFGSARMRDLLDHAKTKFDIVLLDSAPAVVAGDAEALTTVCDSVVLVVRAFSETRGLVRRLRQQLGDHKAAFIGVIVNAVRPSAGGYFMRNVRTSHEYHNGLATAGAVKPDSEEKAA